jgi:preprotein translocase subunit SecG
MAWLVTILLIAVCVLLTAIVLIQNPKGGGINSGLSAANSVIGVKNSADIVEKGTWYLAIGLIAISLFSGVLMGTGVQEEKKPKTSVQTTLPQGSSLNLPAAK